MKHVTVPKKLVVAGRTWLPGNVYEVCDDPDCAELAELGTDRPEAALLIEKGAIETDLPVGAIEVSETTAALAASADKKHAKKRNG